MIIDELRVVLLWWGMWVGLGLLSIPVTQKVFGQLWLKGYFLSKMVGLLIPAFVLWYLSSLKIVPFNRVSVTVSLLTWLGLNVWVGWKDLRNWRFDWERLKPVLLFEVVFLVFYLGYLSIRLHAPNLNVLEKFMNLGFINAVLRTEFMPPQDIWYAGEVLPYYYFGHYLTAFMAKLTSSPTPLAFNLYLASLAGLLAQLVFGLSTSLAKLGWVKTRTRELKNGVLIFGGILGMWFLLLRGNAHVVFYYLHRWFRLQNGLFPDPGAPYVVGDAVQAIPLTMEEMPVYSLLVGDLHAHLMNLLTLLVFLSVLFVVFRAKRLKVWQGLFLGWLIGIAYMTSAWDAPILLVLLAVTVGLRVKSKKVSGQQLLPFGAAVSLAGLATVWPFVNAWQRPLYGVTINTQLSPLLPWLSVWGFEVVVLMVLIPLIRRLKKLKQLNETDWLVSVWMLLAISYILLPEFVYLKLVPSEIDIPDERSNTYLKAAFFSFSLLSVCLCYVIGRVLTFAWKRPWMGYVRYASIGLLVLGIGVSWYPIEIVKSYYNRLTTPKGLDGSAWFKEQWPNDWQAVEWLSQQAGEVRIVESVGEPFTMHGRMSVYSGMPTIVNWLQHEYLWRTMPIPELEQRINDVELLYTNASETELQRVVETYNPTYLVFGELERELYPGFNEQVLLVAGAEVVFSSGATKVYQFK